MSVYSTFSTNETKNVPQTVPLGNATAPNRAGGYSFPVDRWTQLDRFLIIGAEGGTYYASAKETTFDNVACLQKCLTEDGIRTVNRIVEISESGRALKNEPAIYALALCASSTNPKTKTAALQALPRVCRTGTHLFSFAADINRLRGWGPAVRKAFARWYNDKPADKAAYQAVKYQSRNGWSHRDVLRLAHPKTSDPAHNALYRWVVGGVEAFDTYKHRPITESRKNLPAIVEAFEASKAATDVRQVLDLIKTYSLPHECIMNDLKDKPEIWSALLEDMGATALVRNLGKMSKIGLFSGNSTDTKFVVSRLQDMEFIRKGRLHPMQILLAMKTYQQGRGTLGSNTWDINSKIVNALDDAFYASFGAIVPTGKRVLLALDVSGSMGSQCGATGISCREASAAMSMAFLKSESDVEVVGFTASMEGTLYTDNTSIRTLDISPKRRLDDNIRAIKNLPFGGTDCALPFLWAAGNRRDFDAVITMTDNETYAGKTHVGTALSMYRQQVGHPVSFSACAFTATGYSVADEKDSTQMNFVGLDGNLPSVLSDFIREVPAF